MKRSRNGVQKTPPIRYAVVGLGYISQVAVLPAFAHARENSQLVALFSDDPKKLKELGKKYRVSRTYSYEEYDDALREGGIDAVYIAVPNHLHRDYTVRAAEAGVHILCEKPMALTEADCEQMIQAAAQHNVKLMIAYRLHFEAANLKAVEAAQIHKLGEPRLFNSTFTMQVEDKDNYRLKKESGGGPLWDIGIYCINAARYLFQAEPQEVWSSAATGDDPRFTEVDEMNSVVMRFPGERLAAFTCSFGAADVSAYRIVGTKGDLRMEPAYELAEGLVQYLTIDGKTTKKTFPKRDQFAPELVYFSNCIRENREPEPSGREGLADVRVIRAALDSGATRELVTLTPADRQERPTMRQEIRRPPVQRPRLVRAKAPSGD